MLPMLRTRAPRFRPPDDGPSRYVLTERDLNILEELSISRFGTGSQLARMIGGSPKKIIERAGLLMRGGLLQCPPAQGAYYRTGGGSHKVVYAISDQGARELIRAERIDDTGRLRLRLRWSQANQEATRLIVRHTLGVTDFSAALIESCRNHPSLTLLRQKDLIADFPQVTRDSVKPLKLSAALPGRSKADGVIPDLAFGLRFAEGRRCFVLEHDEQTMPVSRSSFDQTSLIKKCCVYELARQRGLHERQCGWRNFRVLFVLPAGKQAGARRANLSKEIAAHPLLQASPLFLIADKSALDAAPNLLAFPWQKPDGSTVTLLEGIGAAKPSAARLRRL